MSKLGLLSLIVMLATFTGCKEDDTQPGDSSILFTFDLKGSEGSRVLEEINPRFILVTIKNQENSQFLYNREKLELFSLGEGYLSEPIDLIIGEYQVEEFIVLDENNHVLYLTPKVGSEFADLVTTPLPTLFSVNPEETTTVSLEVILADLGHAIQYGYAAFEFSVVNTIETGLIAKYLFNNNLMDETENEIHLMPTDNNADIQFVQNRLGEEESAIYFDGTYGVTAVGDSYQQSLFNQSEPQTMAFWFRTDNRNEMQIFGGGMVRIETIGGSRFYTSLKNSQFQLNYGETSVPPYGDLFLVDTLVSNGKWTHVAFVSHGDGTFGEFFKNGQKVSEDLVFTIGNQSSSNPDIVIGGKILENLFVGEIDDVRLYNRALTEKEVLLLFLE